MSFRSNSTINVQKGLLSNNATIKTSTCETLYSGFVNMDGTQMCILATVDIIILIIDICINAAVVYAMVATKQTSNFSSRLILCLSVSDTGIGMIPLPMFAAILLRYSSERICNLELICQFFGIFFCYTSGCIIMAIAFDRLT